MVVRIPRLDVGGNIGAGLGQGLAGLAENLYLQSQEQGMLDELKGMQERNPLAVREMLSKRFGSTQKGRRLAETLFPDIMQTIQQIPEPGQQPMGQPTAMGQPMPGGGVATGYQGAGVQPTQEFAQPTAGAQAQEVPPSQQVMKQPESVKPSFDDLVYDPETLRAGTRDDLRKKYDAPPVLDANRLATRRQQLLTSGRARNQQEADAIARQEFQADLDEFNRGKAQFDLQEERIKNAVAEFTPRFEKVMSGEVDEEFQNGGRYLAEYYALQEDENGRPLHSPREAAEKAMKDLRQMRNLVDSFDAQNALSLTESAFKGSKNRKIQRMKPLVLAAKNAGMSEYLKNRAIANGILSPADASVLFFSPTEETVSAVEKIPVKQPKTADEFNELMLTGLPAPNKQQMQMATDIIKKLSPDESLVALRAMLHDKGFDEASFNEAYETAIASGWEPSPRHEREHQQHLGRPVKYSLGDLWHGNVKDFMTYVRNLIGEKN